MIDADAPPSSPPPSPRLGKYQFYRNRRQVRRQQNAAVAAAASNFLTREHVLLWILNYGPPDDWILSRCSIDRYTKKKDLITIDFDPDFSELNSLIWY